MTVSAPTRRPVFTVANPQAEPPQAWIHAVAVMLLAHVDREIAAERDAGRADDNGQEQEGPEA